MDSQRKYPWITYFGQYLRAVLWKVKTVNNTHAYIACIITKNVTIRTQSNTNDWKLQYYRLNSFLKLFKLFFISVWRGNRRIVEKLKPKNRQHGKFCKLFEKIFKNWHICKIVEFFSGLQLTSSDWWKLAASKNWLK